jgi:hypothetical protein
MHSLQLYASVENFRSIGQVKIVGYRLYDLQKIFFKFSQIKKDVSFKFSKLYVLSIDSCIVSTLRKCAKFQIDWTGQSVLNIDYKICRRQNYFFYFLYRKKF